MYVILVCIYIYLYIFFCIYYISIICKLYHTYNVVCLFLGLINIVIINKLFMHYTVPILLFYCKCLRPRLPVRDH